MELQHSQPLQFGSDIEEVEILFTNGLREQRDVDEGSGETEPSTVSQSPVIDSGCPVATAATLLICAVFFL